MIHTHILLTTLPIRFANNDENYLSISHLHLMTDLALSEFRLQKVVWYPVRKRKKLKGAVHNWQNF